MNRFHDAWRQLMLAGAVLLAATATAAPPYGGMADAQVPRFLIPRLSRPPLLDGRIEADEWREAVALGGVATQQNNELHPRPTTFYLAWDAEHLYLACRVWVMPGFKPKVGGRAPGEARTMDSGLELVLTPRGDNVPKGRPETGYKFNLNALGFAGMFEKVAVGQMVKNWQPDFQTAVQLTEPGSAPGGGRWWQIEAALALADLDLTGPNQAGDAWGLSLGVNGWSGVFTWDRIPCNTGYFIPRGHCVGVLADDAPGVQARVEEFPGPCEGQARVHFSVHNSSARPLEVGIAAEYAALRAGEGDSETAQSLIEKRATLTVGAGETAEFRVDEPLGVTLDKERGTITWRVTQGERELLRYFTYFHTTYPQAYFAAPASAARFPLTASFDPIGSTLRIQCDAYYLDDPAAVQAFSYRVLDDTGRQVIAEGTLPGPVNQYYEELLRLPRLAPGTYAVEVTLQTADGAAPATERTTFERKDEAVAFAEWWQNDIGDVERVIPPFTAMRRDGSAVAMWGRRYELDGLGLPRRIQSADGDVLADGARVVVVTAGGEEHRVRTAQGPRVSETRDWRVAFTGTGSGAGLRFTSQGWVEQDGLCYLELTYEPEGRDPVRVEALRIEFPLAPANAQGLYCIGPGNNFAARTVRLLQPEQGLLWSTLETGRPGSTMRVGSFYPSVWVGDHVRGLSWWADSDQGWLPDNAVPAHQVERRGDAVVLVNNIIGTPATLTGPRTLVFSYTATPFRPLPKGWRASIISENGTFKGPHKGRTDPTTGEQIDTWWTLHPPSRDPAEWGALWAEYKEKADTYVARHQPYDPRRARSSTGPYAHTSIPLLGYPTAMTRSGEPDRYFAPSWQGDRYRNFCRSHSDFLLYLIRRAIDEGGIRTFYWDLFSPSPAASEQAGLGYRLPDGRLQPGYFGFNLRRFSMRLAVLCADRGLTPGAVGVHCTNAFFLPANPWVDAVLDGEEHQITEESAFDWVDGWPVERMRVLSCPHTFGNVVSWMQIISVPGRRGFDLQNQLVEYIRLFDCWGRTFNSGRLVPMPILDWGINDERVEYAPFWANPWAGCSDPDVLVSAWRLPDRLMLAVFNLHRTATKDAQIAVDLKALGLLPELPWQEFIHAAALDSQPAYHRSYWDPRILDALQYDQVDLAWRKDPVLDVAAGQVTVPGLSPRRGRFISIRRY